jgi:hypothetical protein
MGVFGINAQLVTGPHIRTEIIGTEKSRAMLNGIDK